MATIAADGRVIYNATLGCPTSPAQAHTDLLADTGSHLTIIPDTLLTGFQGHYTVGVIIGSNVAGAITEISGLTIEVEIEDHGGGARQMVRSNRPLYAHSLNLAGPHPFLTAAGLLGMDVFDNVQADPVKDHTGGAAYLARRV